MRYQRQGARQRPARAVSLLGANATANWLAEQLGPVPFFRTLRPGSERDDDNEGLTDGASVAELLRKPTGG